MMTMPLRLPEPAIDAARDAIWGFTDSRDGVTLLELMRSAELDCVPLTPMVGAGFELVLCRRPVRLVLRRKIREASRAVDLELGTRAALDSGLPGALALELNDGLRSSALWRTVRAHLERAHALDAQDD